MQQFLMRNRKIFNGLFIYLFIFMISDLSEDNMNENDKNDFIGSSD